MRTLRNRLVLATAVTALGLSLAACSGTPTTPAPSAPMPSTSEQAGNSASASASSDAPEPTRASGTIDSCSLLTPAEVSAINGSGGEPTRDGGTANESFTVDACHYGSLTTGLVSVEVATPASGFNPVTSTLDAAGQPTAIPSLPDGKGYPVGIMLGGGGQGYTVTATSGDTVVAVSFLSGTPVTPAQIEALTAATASAVGKL